MEMQAGGPGLELQSLSTGSLGCSSLGHDSDPVSETDKRRLKQRLVMPFLPYSSGYCQLLLRSLEGRRQKAGEGEGGQAAASSVSNSIKIYHGGGKLMVGMKICIISLLLFSL